MSIKHHTGHHWLCRYLVGLLVFSPIKLVLMVGIGGMIAGNVL
jgi:hypothetical protein